MKFKVGQVWKDGAGDLYTINHVYCSSTAFYSVIAKANNGGSKRTYTKLGRYIDDDKPCILDLVELVQDVDEPEQEQEQERDEIVHAQAEIAHAQAESSGKMLDEYGDRALFDALVVQSVVTGMIERQGVEKVLAGIRMIVEARRSL